MYLSSWVEPQRGLVGTSFAQREMIFSRIEALLRDACAESEVISLIAAGCFKNDIIRGLHERVYPRESLPWRAS
jgi:hypothetical protein